ncbi:hemerythrin domain-containing protein [Yinghuangia seranimata]|uniref:hemerythrin domain-containing protein n=1 Tax=Yinghuangia seranimata TaxID=408067 RepID=UPI0031B9B900
MGHGGDIIHELKADHREVESLFERISAAAHENHKRKRLAEELTVELVRHSVAEEQYLYPAVRARVRDGNALADKELADHAEAEGLLKRLERTVPSDPAFGRLVAKLETEVRVHIRDEERRLFPRLRRACGKAELAALGDDVRRAKQVAPTRPHPTTPSTPTASKVLGPVVGLVDRVRDLFAARGREDWPDVDEAEAADRARARVARREADTWTYDELYAEARRRGVSGRSKMNKQELTSALRR